jgi:hypothetical protein
MEELTIVMLACPTAMNARMGLLALPAKMGIREMPVQIARMDI